MVNELRLIETTDHTICYGLTHTAYLPRQEVDSLTDEQREYLDAHLAEVTESFELILRGLLLEAKATEARLEEEQHGAT